jgi:hypothetical protein
MWNRLEIMVFLTGLISNTVFMTFRACRRLTELCDFTPESRQLKQADALDIFR